MTVKLRDEERSRSKARLKKFMSYCFGVTLFPSLNPSGRGKEEREGGEGVAPSGRDDSRTG